MARLTYEQISELKKQYKTERLYSWSKLDCFSTDKWIYYLRYVARVQPDNKNGAYAVIGNVVHDLLQDFYEKNITNEQMLDKFDEEYDTFSLMGYKFDKSVETKNNKIADKYVACCRHFLQTHQKNEGKTKCEAFVPLVLADENNNNILIQCYIDFLNTYDGVLRVEDYKTSTIYSKKDMEEKKNQLIIYGVALHNALGLPIEKIKLYWNFIKYVDIDYLQANGTWKTRHIERNSIGENLKTSIKMWARKLGYEEDEALRMVNNCIIGNSIDDLPNEIKEKFVINECLVEIKFTEDDINKLEEFILNTVKEIEGLELKYQLTEDENIFWQEVEKKDLYRLINLSDYSAELHLPFKKYLEEYQEKENAKKINIDSIKEKSFENSKSLITDDELERLLG